MTLGGFSPRLAVCAVPPPSQRGLGSVDPV